MAKKRRNKKESTVEKHELPGGFWRQVFAFLLVVVAVLLIVTWFSGENSALTRIREGAMFGIGIAYYILPLILVFFGVAIFRKDNNKLPLVVWIFGFLMVAFLSGFFGAPSYGARDATGGAVGEWLNEFIVPAVGPPVAMMIYFVLIIISILFVTSTSPKTAINGVGKMLKTSKRGEDEKNSKVLRGFDDAAIEKGDKSAKGLKVKAGVEVAGDEEVPESPKKRLGKTEPSESKTPKALVLASDPNWKMPTAELFEKKQSPADAGNIQQNAAIIKSTLEEFGINVEMEGANIGPRVTQYTMKPPSGVNLSKIVARDKELALNLAADKIRIEAPIAGTRLVGVEIPNVKSADVRMRAVLESKEWKKLEDPLSFVIGKDISGDSVVGNLAKMPHLLIAGTTGSGKSVMMNSLLSSLLFRNAPSDLKMIIVDPKQVEMAQYEDIPHLLTPIITQVDKALSALKWAVKEMEQRYSIMAEERVKNIADYNTKVAAGKTKKETDEGGNEIVSGKMPYIVVVVDEMADLMMIAGKELEMEIVRIAQKGRASGIHLVLATQRPEVKVITGLIKANIPGRIAFAVGSQIDSRVMLDMTGAEKLLGKGDMLYLTTEMMGKPKRVQGAFASDSDIDNLTNFLREQSAPQYNDEVTAQAIQIKGMGGGAEGPLMEGGDDARRIAEVAIQAGKLSTSLIQRRLGMGYGRAAKAIDYLEEIGVVGPANGNKPRDVLIHSMDEYPE